MAVPKRKTSKARRDKRRSAVWKLEAPAMSKCDNCGAYKAPHKVCKTADSIRALRSLRWTLNNRLNTKYEKERRRDPSLLFKYLE